MATRLKDSSLPCLFLLFLLLLLLLLNLFTCCPVAPVCQCHFLLPPPIFPLHPIPSPALCYKILIFFFSSQTLACLLQSFLPPGFLPVILDKPVIASPAQSNGCGLGVSFCYSPPLPLFEDNLGEPNNLMSRLFQKK